ncbi:class I SAM-dependent methyltransferase [Mucisphaera calidilacus]|uniref:Class I SAM-dependent methyltransferase n=1 Tax=Mucisphaera calidilacus TaxID=2527982 RepID=A0A518BZA7_9BACT|nr:class I SAM-dependent methyltransferase [Mucisphaera calidilacus]QDU72306.1 hypothetical protein Pan265_21700 [Mucisphaera calidilacus]
MARYPHRLALYRAAVQHPLAEVAMIERAFVRTSERCPLLLREDFAGTAAVSGAWVASHPERQAMAIERHGPTARWARREAARSLGDQAEDLHVVTADVHEVGSPRVDAIAVLNFSLCELHERVALLAYLRHARKGLLGGGMILLDLFGGPGAIRPFTQSRRITPPDLPAFDYHWEQRRFDAASNRIDCRIHFGFDDGHTMRSAFRYDWRLWSPAEVREALAEARYENITVWCDRYDSATHRSDGRYRPVRSISPREDWIAYVTATR